jgi:hypothetical protein
MGCANGDTRARYASTLGFKTSVAFTFLSCFPGNSSVQPFPDEAQNFAVNRWLDRKSMHWPRETAMHEVS